MVRPKKRRRPPRHPLAWPMNLLLWLAVAVVCAGAGGVAGALLGFFATRDPIRELEYYDPPQVTQILDGTGQDVVAEFYSQKRQVLTLAQMPPALPNAFVAIEDERFREHFGLDPRGILRALVTNVRSGSARQGASTITQQMVRNVLDCVGTKRDLTRKLREAQMAIQTEGRYSKDQILEFYLNQIFLGHRAYGVAAAAQTYFGKNVADLTVGECATLAAIPKSPAVINPITNYKRTLDRRNLVLDNMLRLGMIDAETCEREKAAPITMPPGDAPRMSSPYFVDHVRRTLSHNDNVDDDVLTRGGYRVYTTLNAQYQQTLEEEMPECLKRAEKLWQQYKPEREDAEQRDREEHNATRLKEGQTRLAKIREVKEDGVDVELEGKRHFVPYTKEYEGVDEQGERRWAGKYRKPYFDADMVLKKGELLDVLVKSVDAKTGEIELVMGDRQHIQGAAILLDVKTGHVLALVGGSDFYDNANNGNYNRATQGDGRQPGSTFKPFTYAAALSTNRTLATLVDDRKCDYNGYSPKNYENQYFGPMTLYWALTESNNNVTVKIFSELGFKRAFQYFQGFDIVYPKPKWDLEPQLPLCLGSLNCTPLSIAAAYRVFAAQGLAIEPLAVTRVTDLNGAPLTADGSTDLFRPRERKVLSPQVAYLVTANLMEVVREGTGKGVGKYFAKVDYPVPEIAGKTGTTTNCVDAWFVGYTPELVLAVWVGFDNGNRSMGPAMTGGTVVVPGWCKMMDRVLRTRTDWKMTFDMPSDIVKCDILADTGTLAPAGAAERGMRVFEGIPFVKGTEPKQ